MTPRARHPNWNSPGEMGCGCCGWWWQCPNPPRPPFWGLQRCRRCSNAFTHLRQRKCLSPDVKTSCWQGSAIDLKMDSWEISMGKLQGVLLGFLIVLKLRISHSLIYVFPWNSAKDKKRECTTFVLFPQENQPIFSWASLNLDLISLLWCLQSEAGTARVPPGPRGVGCSCTPRMDWGALLLIFISSSAEFPPKGS